MGMACRSGLCAAAPKRIRAPFFSRLDPGMDNFRSQPNPDAPVHWGIAQAYERLAARMLQARIEANEERRFFHAPPYRFRGAQSSSAVHKSPSGGRAATKRLLQLCWPLGIFPFARILPRAAHVKLYKYSSFPIPMPKIRASSTRHLLPCATQIHDELLEACCKAPLSRIQELLAAGANPLWQGDQGSHCSITRCAALGRLGPLCAVADHAAASSSSAQDLHEALREAAEMAIEHGHLSCLKAILARLPIAHEPSKPSRHASLLIDCAAIHARPSMLALLLAKFPAPWAALPSRRDHPLETAAIFGGEEGLQMVKLFLAAKKANGRKALSPADLAAGLLAACDGRGGSQHRAVIVAALLAAGADPKRPRSPDGWTPLMSALALGDHGLVRMLFPLSDLSAATASGKTLLDISKAGPRASCHDLFKSLLLAREERIIFSEASPSLPQAVGRRSRRI